MFGQCLTTADSDRLRNGPKRCRWFRCRRIDLGGLYVFESASVVDLSVPGVDFCSRERVSKNLLNNSHTIKSYHAHPHQTAPISKLFKPTSFKQNPLLKLGELEVLTWMHTFKKLNYNSVKLFPFLSKWWNLQVTNCIVKLEFDNYHPSGLRMGKYIFVSKWWRTSIIILIWRNTVVASSNRISRAKWRWKLDLNSCQNKLAMRCQI